MTDCSTNEVPFSLLGYERQSVSKRLGCGGELARALGQICPYQMPGRIGRQHLTALYGLGVFHFGDRQSAVYTDNRVGRDRIKGIVKLAPFIRQILSCQPLIDMAGLDLGVQQIRVDRRSVPAGVLQRPIGGRPDQR